MRQLEKTMPAPGGGRHCGRAKTSSFVCFLRVSNARSVVRRDEHSHILITQRRAYSFNSRRRPQYHMGRIRRSSTKFLAVPEPEMHADNTRASSPSRTELLLYKVI